MLMVAIIEEVLNVIVSPISKVFSFSYTNLIWFDPSTYTTRASDPEEFPISCSPVFALFTKLSDWDETVNAGRVGLLLSFDSKTPKIL